MKFTISIMCLIGAMAAFAPPIPVGVFAGKATVSSGIVSSNSMLSYQKFQDNLLDSFQSGWSDNNGISFSSGVIGQAVITTREDNSDPCNPIPAKFVSHGNFSLGSTWTITMWAYFNDVGSSMWMIEKSTDNTDGFILLMESGASFDFYITGTYKLSSSVTVDAGKWYFIVIKQSGTTQSMKVNNGSWETLSNAGYTDAAVSWKIGASFADDSGANAVFDEVSIFNRELTDQEITLLVGDFNFGTQTGTPVRPQLPP